MHAARRFNIIESGEPSATPVVFVHGFGCDQSMWRHMRTPFEDAYRVISFDLMGLGGSELSYYDEMKYSSLDGYAGDVLMILDDLELTDVLLVGHSVGASIGAMAAARRPDAFGALALLVPSARYIDDDGYRGGFSAADIDDLLEALDSNYLGWAATMAPLIMGQPDRPELGQELTELFCQAEPSVASRFARATFLADNRAELRQVQTPTLIVACNDDIIAPPSAIEYVHRTIEGSTLVQLDAIGHCPNLSAPAETARAVLDFHAGLRQPTAV